MARRAPGSAGRDIRDLMLEAVEAASAPSGRRTRSNGSRTMAPLHGQGHPRLRPCSGFVPCFTPVASPESNGIAEAFVKTFKRDYVRVNPLPDAVTVLRQIDRMVRRLQLANTSSSLAVVVLRPEVRLACHVDQLRGDPQAGRRPCARCPRGSCRRCSSRPDLGDALAGRPCTA